MKQLGLLTLTFVLFLCLLTTAKAACGKSSKREVAEKSEVKLKKSSRLEALRTQLQGQSGTFRI